MVAAPVPERLRRLEHTRRAACQRLQLAGILLACWAAAASQSARHCARPGVLLPRRLPGVQPSLDGGVSLMPGVAFQSERCLDGDTPVSGGRARARRAPRRRSSARRILSGKPGCPAPRRTGRKRCASQLVRAAANSSRAGRGCAPVCGRTESSLRRRRVGVSRMAASRGA